MWLSDKKYLLKARRFSFDHIAQLQWGPDPGGGHSDWPGPHLRHTLREAAQGQGSHELNAHKGSCISR